MFIFLLRLQFLQTETLKRSLALLLERISVNAGNRCHLPDGACVHRPSYKPSDYYYSSKKSMLCCMNGGLCVEVIKDLQ